jgi:tRNA threonylcarbamoyladenosine biosynthesis protein TsaB
VRRRGEPSVRGAECLRKAMRAVVRVLGIDTACAAAGIAVVEDERVLASLYVRQAPHSPRPVLRAIDTLLHWAGCELAGLDGLVVNVGPGAFTGVRIGLALAQGLALASGLPLVGCKAFEALVALVPEWAGMICPVIEARKGEIYAAMYRQHDGRCQEVVPGMVGPPEALDSLITERTLFLGSAVGVYGKLFASLFGARAVCRTVSNGGELVVGLARQGLARLRASTPETLPTPTPLYIRPADARLPPYRTQAVGVPQYRSGRTSSLQERG